ncbi:MAG: hypothetical protein C5B49_07115 [Bdellovibrio sp.]|nr:MAG: hypothetical protein C5B49_07115 [Bdellovibrio sp.]
MVIEDLSQSAGAPNKVMPQVHDRFLAFAFDLTLWAPIGAVLLKPWWRRIQYLSVTASQSAELTLLMVITVTTFAFLFVFAQALMNWRFGGTPGKRVFHLRVVSVRDGKPPTLGASLLRSLVWALEWVFLGLPFLEVLSHPSRRPWHDRISETVVVSEKLIGGDTPHWIERRFFRNLYWGAFAVFLLWAAVLAKQTLLSIEHGRMKRDELVEAGYLCSQIPTPAKGNDADDSSPSARLDLGISLFLLDQVPAECLESEADFAIWTQDPDALQWAHLARGFLRSAEVPKAPTWDSESEFLKACGADAEDQDASPCELARWRKSKIPPQQKETSESWTYKTARVRDLLREGRFREMEKFIQAQVWPEPIAPLMQIRDLQSRWMTGTAKSYADELDLIAVGLNGEDRVKLEAWSCLAALTRHCGREPVKPCEELRRDSEIRSAAEIAKPVVLALTREASCSNRMGQRTEGLFARVFARGRPEESWLEAWLFHQSTQVGAVGTSAVDHRWDKIYEAAAKIEVDHWLYAQSLWALTSLGRSKEQFFRLGQLFARGPSDDIFWWIARQSYQEKVHQFGDEFQMRLPSSSPPHGKDDTE